MLNHEQLLKLIRDKVEHPATPRELLQRLKIPRDERPTLKRLLKDLVAQGELVETRGNRYGLPDRMNLIVGRITTHPRGFGFVVPDRPVEGVNGDIYVAGSNLNQAMHGDRVVARVERVTERGAEGRILRDRAWELCTLFDINFTPKGMSVEQLQHGFLGLVKQLYSAEETQTRRRRFKRMLKTSPNFARHTPTREHLLAA